MVEQAIATFGRLDAAYNNAGVQNVLAETADATREDFDRVIAIDLRGVWSCMKFELRQMPQAPVLRVRSRTAPWWPLRVFHQTIWSRTTSA